MASRNFCYSVAVVITHAILVGRIVTEFTDPHTETPPTPKHWSTTTHRSTEVTTPKR